MQRRAKWNNFEQTMNQLMTLLALIAVATTGCVAANHGRSLTSGQALSLARPKLPTPDIGQAYGVQFKNGIWWVCLYSASFMTNGPSGIVVAKVKDADGKVEVLQRLPQTMGIVPENPTNWIWQAAPAKART
jgi:hypothetical protein